MRQVGFRRRVRGGRSVDFRIGRHCSCRGQRFGRLFGWGLVTVFCLLCRLCGIILSSLLARGERQAFFLSGHRRPPPSPPSCSTRWEWAGDREPGQRRVEGFVRGGLGRRGRRSLRRLRLGDRRRRVHGVVCRGRRSRHVCLRVRGRSRRCRLGRMHTLHWRCVGVHNGRRLTHGAVDGRHMRMRRDYNGRGVRLELAWRHDILRLRLVVRIPLRHLLHVLGIAVGGRIVLGVVVLRVRVVVHRRMRLWRHVVVVLVILPPSLVHGTGRRTMRAWHHGRQAAMLPLQSVAGQTDQAANVRGNGRGRRAASWAIARTTRGVMGTGARGRAGCGEAGEDNYCWDAEEGRATAAGGGGRLLQVAGQSAERGVIVSARHERAESARGERREVCVDVGRRGRRGREMGSMERVRMSRGAAPLDPRTDAVNRGPSERQRLGSATGTAAHTPWIACLSVSGLGAQSRDRITCLWIASEYVLCFHLRCEWQGCLKTTTCSRDQ
jgi:hypothetical protein